MSNETRSDTPARPGRRAVVRAGVTAAWTAPVIAVAAPAQATACSGGSTTVLAVKGPGGVTVSGSTVTFKVTLTNTGSKATCALSATATVAAGSKKLDFLSVSTWPAASGGSAGATSLTVSAPATGQLAAHASAVYPVTVQLHDGSGKHTITVTFRTSNGASSAVSVSVG